MRNAKVLLKDVPFENMKKGDVITFYNGSYIKERGTTWYDGNMSGSSDGMLVFGKAESSIINIMWDLEEWFSSTNISPIKYTRSNKSITLSFDNPLDLSDIEAIAMGIRKTLREHYKNTAIAMGWQDEKVNITF